MQPVLYTFRRCPYAIRARMSLAYAKIDYEAREVVLRDKPSSMLDLSPKGTVPVLQLGELVLDESIDIVDWALSRKDPDGWLNYDAASLAEMAALVRRCDFDFKPSLDRYKYADRHPERTIVDYRSEGEAFLQALEDRLASQSEEDGYLFGARPSYADVAVFPFIRQFAHVDRDWFQTSPYSQLRRWLDAWLESDLFLSVMQKYPQWHEADSAGRN